MKGSGFNRPQWHTFGIILQTKVAVGLNRQTPNTVILLLENRMIDAFHQRIKALNLSDRVGWLILIGLIPALSIGCGSGEGGLYVSGTTTPVFEIRRDSSNEVRIFPLLMLVQLHPENMKVPPLQEDDSKNRILWKIVADPKATDSANLERIERIEYGKVPIGFVQEVPNEGIQVPRLQENEVYEVVGPMSLMRNAAARFKIVNGNVISLPMP